MCGILANLLKTDSTFYRNYVMRYSGSHAFFPNGSLKDETDRRCCIPLRDVRDAFIR